MMRFIKTKAEWRINENLSQARKILKDNSIPETDEKFIFLKNSLKNNSGYLGWFTKMAYVNNVLSSDITQILDLIKSDKYVIDNLPKNLIKYKIGVFATAVSSGLTLIIQVIIKMLQSPSGPTP